MLPCMVDEDEYNGRTNERIAALLDAPILEGGVIINSCGVGAETRYDQSVSHTQRGRLDEDAVTIIGRRPASDGAFSLPPSLIHARLPANVVVVVLPTRTDRTLARQDEEHDAQRRC